MTCGFSPDIPIATCLLIQSSGLLGDSVAGGYLWKPSLHKSVKESQMHESSALLGIAISLLTRSRVGFRSGEVRNLKELVVLNILLAIIVAAIYIAFA